MTRPKLISREEVLGGMPGRAAKQANTLLALIESRTAYLMVQSHQVATFSLTEATAQAPQRAFLEAIAQGRDLPIQPTIQDLEHYASQWAILVPANPDIRANVAHLLGQKYEFTA